MTIFYPPIDVSPGLVASQSDLSPSQSGMPSPPLRAQSGMPSPPLRAQTALEDDLSIKVTSGYIKDLDKFLRLISEKNCPEFLVAVKDTACPLLYGYLFCAGPASLRQEAEADLLKELD